MSVNFNNKKTELVFLTDFFFYIVLYKIIGP